MVYATEEAAATKAARDPRPEGADGSSADRMGEALDGLSAAAKGYRRLATIAFLRKVVGARRLGVVLAFFAYGALTLAFVTLSLVILLLWGAAGLIASVLEAPLWAGALITSMLGVVLLTVLAVRFWRRQVRSRIEYLRSRLRSEVA